MQMTTEDAHEPTPAAGTGQVRVLARGSTAEDRFTAFAEASVAGLTRIAIMLSGDEHRAADLVQLALERTYRAWDRVGDGEPYAYARKVIATARIDSWRSTRRDVLSDPHQFLGPAVPDSTESLLRRDELVRALRTLPPSQRRVIVLRYLLDQTEAQTAEELGISLGSVKSASSRGLARLRGVLDGTLEAAATMPAPAPEVGHAMARRAVRHERRRRVVLAAGAAALAVLLLVAGVWAGSGMLHAGPVLPAEPVLPGEPSSILGNTAPVWDDPPLRQDLGTPPDSWKEEAVGPLRLAVPSDWTNDSAAQASGRHAAWFDGSAENRDGAALNIHRQDERYPWDRTTTADVTRLDVDGAASVLVVRDDHWDVIDDIDQPVHQSIVEIVLEEGGVYILELTAPDGDDDTDEQLLDALLGSLAIAAP
jgi:RNA polymerase sigma-70 factor (sigma-E family)